MTSLYSYVMTHDSGFAPNPFHGYCTLATCKGGEKGLRRHAERGDWIIGTSSKTLANDSFDLIYAMKVTEEPLTFQEYNDHPDFQEKKPEDGNWVTQRGDNIYHRQDEAWEQRDNPFHGEDERETDINGKNVLVSNRFVYFGQGRIRLPADYRELANAYSDGRGKRNYKKVSDSETITEFLEWLEEELEAQNPSWGRLGDPHDSDLKKDWRQSRRDHSCGHGH